MIQLDTLRNLCIWRDRRSKRDREEDEELINATNLVSIRKHSTALGRKRWDMEHMVGLALQEGSFVTEYRLTPQGFDILHEMLAGSLEVDQNMAAIAMAKCGNGPISTASRLGAALILLGGGRQMEAMRTHGMSATTSKKNF